MSSSATSLLFGESDSYWLGTEPWYQYDCGEIKQVSQIAMDFISNTIGLHGDKHDQHGWIINLATWAALTQYVRWCDEQGLDFLFHASMINEGDATYQELCTKQMQKLLDQAQQLK
jgi:hypothetical protein